MVCLAAAAGSILQIEPKNYYMVQAATLNQQGKLPKRLKKMR